MIKIGEPPRSNLANELNDSLDDILSAPAGAVRVEPIRAPVDYQPLAYDEVCGRCGGTGRTRWGTCFRCKGAGKKTLRTSPKARAQGRENAAARKAREALSNWNCFYAANPEVGGWILANPNFEFAAKMKVAVEQWGSLTANQLSACWRGVAREEAKAAERVKVQVSAPEVSAAGVDRLKAAFNHAIAYSRSKGKGRNLRNPKITIGGITISPAKAESANAGALYVKERGEYRGMIKGGKFLARNCPAATADKILAFIADPKAAAETYGIETGICCICNATLTNKESIERGIGPICGEKFGWYNEILDIERMGIGPAAKR